MLHTSPILVKNGLKVSESNYRDEFVLPFVVMKESVDNERQ